MRINFHEHTRGPNLAAPPPPGAGGNWDMQCILHKTLKMQLLKKPGVRCGLYLRPALWPTGIDTLELRCRCEHMWLDGCWLSKSSHSLYPKTCVYLLECDVEKGKCNTSRPCDDGENYIPENIDINGKDILRSLVGGGMDTSGNDYRYFEWLLCRYQGTPWCGLGPLPRSFWADPPSQASIDAYLGALESEVRKGMQAELDKYDLACDRDRNPARDARLAEYDRREAEENGDFQKMQMLDQERAATEKAALELAEKEKKFGISPGRPCKVLCRSAWLKAKELCFGKATCLADAQKALDECMAKCDEESRDSTQHY